MKNLYFLPKILLITSLLLVSHDLLAGGILGIFPKGLKPNGLIFTLFTFSGIIAALFIHELGHLLAGLAQGFRLQLFVVFLFGIRRTENGLKIYLNKNAGHMGGLAATTPVAQSADNRKKFARVLLAGPMASLFFGVLCLLLVIFTRNMLWSFWLIAGSASVGIFFATTLPRKSGIYFTDRARFQRLISKGQAGRSEEALLAILAQTTGENSYKNISLKNTAELKKDNEPFMRFWGHYYEYQYFLANENMLQASDSKAELIKLKEAITASVWKVLRLDEEQPGS